jgi:prepilin-type N-terminal cleavage/methylation domain-containing protein
MMNRKGFTIIELVVVMAILAILSAFAYPRIAGYMEMNREKHRANHEYMVNKALMQYYALRGSYYKAQYLTNEIMADDDARAMIDELKRITGAQIEDPVGTYKYKKAEGYDDPDVLSNCTIRAVKAEAS